MARLQGHGLAVLTICNTLALTIKIKDEDTVLYQFSNEDEVHEAEIVYNRDEDDTLGYGEEDETYPSFTTEGGVTYFIGEFLRVDL